MIPVVAALLSGSLWMTPAMAARTAPVIAAAAKKRGPVRAPVIDDKPADKAAPKAERAPGAPAGAPAGDVAVGPRGPTRIDFDDRLIQGQTNKSGAVYLFDRKELSVRSMVRQRTGFRDQIVKDILTE